MVVTTLDLKEKYKEYTDINGKIKRDVKSNILFPVVRGIYETNSNTSGYLLASFIYGPSYLSFEYALSFHNIIPERVVTYTSATFNKRKNKEYKNVFGYYTYRDIPKTAFHYFVKAYVEGSYSYFIASPEKALCDLLYILPPVKSVKALEKLLFQSLRIDIDKFNSLNLNDMRFLSNKYISNNIKFLVKLIERTSKKWQYLSKWLIFIIRKH